MNKERRNKIDDIIERLEGISTEIEELADEELESYENMPESLQGTDRYDTSVEAEENLRGASEDISDIVSKLEDAKG